MVEYAIIDTYPLHAIKLASGGFDDTARNLAFSLCMPIEAMIRLNISYDAFDQGAAKGMLTVLALPKDRYLIILTRYSGYAKDGRRRMVALSFLFNKEEYLSIGANPYNLKPLIEIDTVNIDDELDTIEDRINQIWDSKSNITFDYVKKYPGLLDLLFLGIPYIIVLKEDNPDDFALKEALNLVPPSMRLIAFSNFSIEPERIIDYMDYLFIPKKLGSLYLRDESAIKLEGLKNPQSEYSQAIISFLEKGYGKRYLLP